MHEPGLLPRLRASREQQCTELWFKQSKLRFLLLHFNAVKPVHLHYLQDVSLGMERKKYLIHRVNPQAQNLILFKWVPLSNSFSRWNWSQNIPERDGSIPYSLPIGKWDSSQASLFVLFWNESKFASVKLRELKRRGSPQKQRKKHDWGQQQKELIISLSVGSFICGILSNLMTRSIEQRHRHGFLNLVDSKRH